MQNLYSSKVCYVDVVLECSDGDKLITVYLFEFHKFMIWPMVASGQGHVP